MIIFVTGGAGFIGGSLIRNFIESTHHTIINIDKLTYAGNIDSLAEVSNSKNYSHECIDICNTELLNSIFLNFKPDCVMHLAAESHVDRSIHSPDEFMLTNIMGTYRLLQEVRFFFNELSNLDQKSFRFLHVSTDEVYGTLSLTDPPFKEINKYEPNSPYSASKASSDHLVRAWHHTYGLPVLTTNCSNNYGPYQFPEKLIPLMILNACEGKSLPIYGDGSNIRDWLHVEDHCSGILSVLRKGRAGETYCIGGASEKTNMEVIDTLCYILDKHHPVGAPHNQLKTFVKDRPGHDHRYAIDFSKIENELGWQPSFSFEEGMQQTVQWYLNNQEWCENVTSGKYQRERLGI